MQTLKRGKVDIVAKIDFSFTVILLLFPVYYFYLLLLFNQQSFYHVTWRLEFYFWNLEVSSAVGTPLPVLSKMLYQVSKWHRTPCSFWYFICWPSIRNVLDPGSTYRVRCNQIWLITWMRISSLSRKEVHS